MRKPGRKLPGSSIADRLSLPSERILAALAARTPAETAFGDQRHVLLVTYRRDGRPVATPVWAAKVGEAVYVRTQRMSGKVKRLARDGHCLVAPCGPRGSPVGGAVRATGRLLADDEEAAAERFLAAKYGLVRRICAAAQDALRVDMCYLKLCIENDRLVRPDLGVKTSGR